MIAALHRALTSTSRYDARANLGLLAIRLMLGAVFVFHGGQKLFGWFGGYGLAGTAQWMESIGIPFGTLNAALAGSTELLGGLALATGLGLRLLAVPLVVTMLVASFTAHTGFAAQTGGMEYPLTLGVVVGALFLTGPGEYALGRLLVGQRSEQAPASPARELAAALVA